MNAPPEGFDAGALPGFLADGWGFDVKAIDYAPVGFGSYHWIATNGGGASRFVTVDDLDRMPSLGSSRETVFDGLRRAFGSAVALHDAGLDFVVAPIPTRDGEPVRRVGMRHTVALFPFVEGEAGESFEDGAVEQRQAVISMLSRLHEATPAVDSVARRIDLRLPGRAWLESGLREVNVTWSGGPFSEPARKALASHADDVADRLGAFDRLSREVAGRSRRWVITHGEPHPFNVLRTDAGYALVDWDTVALAPPERDLWMVLGPTEVEEAAYAGATGHQPDRVVMDFFRLTWDLTDIADFIHLLRSPHRRSEDTQTAFTGLEKYVSVRS